MNCINPKFKVCKKCKSCDKTLAHWNKSGYCTACYTRLKHKEYNKIKKNQKRMVQRCKCGRIISRIKPSKLGLCRYCRHEEWLKENKELVLEYSRRYLRKKAQNKPMEIIAR